MTVMKPTVLNVHKRGRAIKKYLNCQLQEAIQAAASSSWSKWKRLKELLGEGEVDKEIRMNDGIA